MSATRRESTKRNYHERMLRVLDHIHHHLDEELTLAGLARVACFSPYHCIENYLNHPRNASVEDLRTEIYVPLQAVA